MDLLLLRLLLTMVHVMWLFDFVWLLMDGHLVMYMDKRRRSETANERHSVGIRLRMIKRKGHCRGHDSTRHALCVSGKSRVTDWRFVGTKKLHELPEVLQAKTKTSSQNNLKNFLTSYLTTACIEPEYYSVRQVYKSLRHHKHENFILPIQMVKTSP